MKHLLDNPVWNALISGNENLSNGNDIARYYSPEVSPFAGIAENSPENFQLLHQVIPFDAPVAVVTNEKGLDPAPWYIIDCIDGLQMTFLGQAEPKNDEIELVPLTAEHVPYMLELTNLTKPGPFSANTIAFGNYEGIFDGHKLVAMAGQRMHAGKNIEISAVCTHPDYLGRGYARQLIFSQIRNIQQRSEIPFLHVRADNTRAISVYESMGFSIRNEMFIYILKK